MRKIVSSFLVLLFMFFLARPQTARAEIPVRARAFATIVSYGAASGALLGAASLAFGQSSRAIFQGASLGMYAGILFGTYVLVSHHNRGAGAYDDAGTPYKESSDIYGDEYQPEEGGDSGVDTQRGGFFNRHEQSGLPPIYINFVQYTF